ncbi:MAG: patatin-like phospholipase family protein [Gemmatimonadota bacterium]
MLRRLSSLIPPAIARSAATLTCAVLLPACSAVHRPATTIPALVADADSSRLAERRLRDTVIARLARRAVARPDHALDVLMLSGGGQNGAYGVGFMRGWRARTDAPMPQFDLITAISTGALQAPFVLLGTPAAHDTLTALYRNAADRIAPSIDWLFWLRKTGGVVNMKKYDANLRQVVSAGFRDSLQHAFAADRQVIFGTTDLDIATGRAWDLRSTFAGGDEGLVRTRTLLKAASAIPGIFPQVVYEGHVHSDGGVVSNILTLLTLDDYKAVLAKVRAAGVTTPVRINLYVIVNGWTHAAPVVMNPASRKQINGRWSTLSFYMHQPQVLEGLENLAAAASAVPGLTMQMRWTAIPSETALDPAANSLFNKAWMLKLEQLGEQRAAGRLPWDTVVSPYARPAVAQP